MTPPPGRVTERAPVKVNLSLLVTGRRADGYHLLDSLVVFGPAYDVLHAEPAEGLSLQIKGPFAGELAAGEDNLVLRAARGLAACAGIEPRAALVLDKRVPVASGIGGGSADAAAALRLLCGVWGCHPGEAALAALALSLGADVPVCLRSAPARMTGVGEKLAPLPALPPCGLLLANPGLAVATADVFRARTAAFSASAAPPAGWPDAAALAASLASLGNDLQPPACAVCPPVTAVLERLAALPGCLLARMSGSGATCFALFADPAAAQAAAGLLPVAWWCAAGPLYEPPSAALLTQATGWGVAKR